MLATQLGGYAISIHAPHGVRPHRSTNARYNVPPFQSTHDTGRDVIRRFRLYNRFWISIHAPHRARLYIANEGLSILEFQSTRHTGRDVPEDKYSLLLDKFQSTRHTGRDHGSQAARTRRNLFQSTRHTGRDVTIEVVYSTDTFISIHAPHRARLHYSFDSSLPSQISIHAPHRARRRTHLPTVYLPLYFNPRATQGATSVEGVGGGYYQFQSTRHTGCDRTILYNFLLFCRISIHAPHGVRRQKSATISETLRYR